MANVFERVNILAGRSSGSGMTRPQIRSVISAAERVCGLNEGEILRERVGSSSPRVSRARTIAVYLIRCESGFDYRRIKIIFGLNSVSSVDTILCRARSRLRFGRKSYDAKFRVEVLQVRRQAGFE